MKTCTHSVMALCAVALACLTAPSMARAGAHAPNAPQALHRVCCKTGNDYRMVPFVACRPPGRAMTAHMCLIMNTTICCQTRFANGTTTYQIVKRSECRNQEAGMMATYLKKMVHMGHCTGSSPQSRHRGRHRPRPH